MIVYIMAMKCEAEPFINRLMLKRDPSYTNLEVYLGDDIRLCVTGMGKIDAASAVSQLLSSLPDPENALIVNAGTCAGRSQGTLYRINRIYDSDSSKDQYPDLIYKTDYPEMCLHTSDSYKTDDCFEDEMGEFVCDMEGSAIIRVASSFVSPDRILMFKIVSDLAEPELVTYEYCVELIGRYTDNIIEAVNRIKSGLISRDPYEQADMLCEKYASELHCTGYMTNALSRIIRYALSEGIDVDNMLTPYLPVLSKKEGKEVLSDVERKLILR